MTQTVTLLETIEADNNGEKKSTSRHFGTVDAICDAWRQHKEFLNSQKGGAFDKGETLNCDDVEFGQVLCKKRMVILKSADKTIWRIYSLSEVRISTDVEI